MIHKIIELDFARLELYEDYLVSTIHEGVLFKREHLESFYEVFDIYYPGKPFGYISNRQYEYTIDPTCYLNSNESPWLAAMAVLCNTENTFNMALFERKFYKNRPFKPFYDQNECLQWLTHKIGQHSKDRPPITI